MRFLGEPIFLILSIASTVIAGFLLPGAIAKHLESPEKRVQKIVHELFLIRYNEDVEGKVHLDIAREYLEHFLQENQSNNLPKSTEEN